ncbi:MAG: crossover junction endodeoxyribonuclease RuvC [Candidatus Berkelbacteria bacterium]|nr:crossover junction endodeoxyribonuclease RuvC [Candidatus Berkelbacteria bacterium]
MRILGLDPGTATTGYGVIEIEKQQLEVKNFKLITYGVINTKANGYMPQRLCEIYKQIRKLIEKHKPDQIALESLFFFRNQKTVITVAQARGVIMMACQGKKVPLVEYPPLQVKNVLCKNGRADKKEVQEEVKKILKLKHIPKPDDAADALAAAICCVRMKGKNTHHSKKQ